MLERIKKFLGVGAETNYKQLVDKGATIIDVRTPKEYSFGHIPDSVNIPITLLAERIGRFAKEEQIILCCASGMRSSSAKEVLMSMGYSNVHNGGSWSRLLAKIK